MTVTSTERKRLFFALWPSHRQRELLRDALRPVMTSVEGQAVDRRNWHVTLVFIGDFPEAQVPFLQAAAAEIPLEPFRLRFDRLEYWPRASVAVLRPLTVPAPLQALAQSLESALVAFDIQPEEREYRPHITLARRARKFETARLGRPVDLEWSGFELVESVPTSSGVQYRPLAP